MSPQVRIVFEVCVVDSYSPDEGRTSREGDDDSPELPRRVGGAGRTAHTEARAELRDRETYYAELRLAVYGQSRSAPRPREPLDDQRAPVDGEKADTWTSEDDMTVRFDDTWT
jgi:hypothetical protein